MTITTAELAAALPDAQHRGDATVHDATHDSRQVRAGWLFCAVRGATTDGHDHAPRAVEQGAAALLVERWLDLDVPQVRVPAVRPAMGEAAALVHSRPSHDLTVVGVTGTNGKTTIAFLLEDAFGAAGWGTGTIGTVETRIHGAAHPGVRTTPEGPDLQRLLATMRDRGVDAVGMEVSSHGLDLHRTAGTRFACAVFTNLSQDHLDWHGTMEAYFDAKARLFTPEMTAQALICLDDEWGHRLAGRARVPFATYGRDGEADWVVVDTAVGLDGGRARLRGPEGAEAEVRTRLLGDFNLLNAVGAYLAAVSVGVPPDAASTGLAASPGAPGRLDRVEAGQPFTVLVDYAHTPDALTHVVTAMRELLARDGRLHLVVGCGGDRDRGKRPLMGAAALRADRAVLTSDNPRSEEPTAIIDEMLAGAHDARAHGATGELVVEPDRRRAIADALAAARPDDVVVIAGKGHETGQELADRTVPFDDRLVAAQLLSASSPSIAAPPGSGRLDPPSREDPGSGSPSIAAPPGSGSPSIAAPPGSGRLDPPSREDPGPGAAAGSGSPSTSGSSQGPSLEAPESGA